VHSHALKLKKIIILSGKVYQEISSVFS